MALHVTPSVALDGADIILRSSDGVSYHVHKSRLRNASPHFRSMFAIAPPSLSDTQTIEIELPAALLSYLVQLIYADELQPAPCDLSPRTIDDAMIVLEAARKLELDDVEKAFLSGAFTRALAAEENPLRAWAVATSLGLEKAAREGALRYLLSPTDYADKWRTMPDLARVNALTFSQLVGMRAEKIPVLQSLLVDILCPTECTRCPRCQAAQLAMVEMEHEELTRFWAARSPKSAIREALDGLQLHPMALEAGSPTIYALAARIITCKECERGVAEYHSTAKQGRETGWHQKLLKERVKRKRLFDKFLNTL